MTDNLSRGQTITQTVLVLISFPIMYFLVFKCVSDTNYFSENAVIPPVHVLVKAEPTTYPAEGDSDVA